MGRSIMKPIKQIPLPIVKRRLKQKPLPWVYVLQPEVDKMLGIKRRVRPAPQDAHNKIKTKVHLLVPRQCVIHQRKKPE